MNYILSILFLLIFYIASSFTGKVTKIIDGDTFHLVNDKNKFYKIRIADIDAPELKQFLGKKAKDVVSKKILGKKVKIIIKSNDKYGRIVGFVIYNNKNLGEELLREGIVWKWYFSKNYKYKKIENIARNKKIGIWKYKNLINPYFWRKNNKK